MALETDIIYQLVTSGLICHLLFPPFCLRVFGRDNDVALVRMHYIQLPEPISSVAYTKIVQKMLHQFQNPHESTMISGWSEPNHFSLQPHIHKSFFSSPEYCKIKWVYIAINIQGLYPVSYTHLDVYKRQIPDR